MANETTGADVNDASFKVQLNALLRKNIRYQRRNKCTNCCLTMTPLLFSMMLFGIKSALNVVFDRPEFKCGCLCLKRCRDVSDECFDLPDAGRWPQMLDLASGAELSPYDETFECVKRDLDKCGAEYSDPGNAYWCPIEHPTAWPPMIGVPNTGNRAPVADTPCDENVREKYFDQMTQKMEDDAMCPASILYTGALGESAAAALSGNFAPNDVILPLAALVDDEGALQAAAGGLLLAMFEPFLGPGAGAIAQSLGADAPPLSKPALSVSGGNAMEGRGYYDQGIFGGAPIHYVVEDCESVPQAVQTTISDMAMLVGLSKPLQCLSAKHQWLDSEADINEVLFAGYGKGAAEAQGLVAKQAKTEEYMFAVDWQDTKPGDSARLNVRLWVNRTEIQERGGGPAPMRRFPAVLAMVTKAFTSALTDENTGDKYTEPIARLLHLREMPKVGTQLSLDFASFLGPLFYTWLSQLLLPVMVGLLVYEKENKLRVMMKMQGLGDTSYWIINYGYYFLLHMIFFLLVLIFGYVLQVSLMTLSEVGVVLVFWILFTNLQIAVAFVFTATFTSTKTATTAAQCYVILSGLLSEFLLSQYIESKSFAPGAVTALQLIPPFGLYRGYYEMAQYAFNGDYTATFGITWEKMSDSYNQMGDVMVGFFVEGILFLLLAAYLDQVLDTGSGIKRHPLFFLDWCSANRRKAVAASQLELAQIQQKKPEGEKQSTEVVMEPADVAAERHYAETQATPEEHPIILKRLRQVYPASTGVAPKVACESLSLAIPRGSCFGLIGPNGAGKSTSINMMVGLQQPTSGSATICGLDIMQDMGQIYKRMGVCPQHDLLWERLTAREHLEFYARLKNVAEAGLTSEVDRVLTSVNLLSAGDVQVGRYSGGMKRRLSVAISFIGEPEVVYLDEPSTGLDPASRRNLWHVIREAKRSTAIVLTTHSMAEAEELCDRLGIFVDGGLQCVGNPKELTARYGGFLIFTVVTAEADVGAIAERVRAVAPGARCTAAIGGMQRFDLPLEEADFTKIFRAMEAAKSEGLRIHDWGVANMTLEEVFIKISRSIGADAITN